MRSGLRLQSMVPHSKFPLWLAKREGTPDKPGAWTWPGGFEGAVRDPKLAMAFFKGLSTVPAGTCAVLHARGSVKSQPCSSQARTVCVQPKTWCEDALQVAGPSAPAYNAPVVASPSPLPSHAPLPAQLSAQASPSLQPQPDASKAGSAMPAPAESLTQPPQQQQQARRLQATPTATPAPGEELRLDRMTVAHCPPGFQASSPFSGACVHFGWGAAFMSQPDALAHCADAFPGSSLFVPSSAAELAWFQGQLTTHFAAPDMQRAWMGAGVGFPSVRGHMWYGTGDNAPANDIIAAPPSGSWSTPPDIGLNCVSLGVSGGLHATDCADETTALPVCAVRPIGCPAKWVSNPTATSCGIHLDVVPGTASEVSWDTLEAQCAAEGGHLAYPPAAPVDHGDQPWDWLRHVLLQEFNTGRPRYGQRVAVGAHMENGQWVWGDGKPVPGNLWRGGVPDGSTGKCSSFYIGRLEPAPCNTTGLFSEGGFVCVAPPPLCPDGDTVDPTTGQCIKLVEVPSGSGAADASDICAAAAPADSPRVASPARLWTSRSIQWWNSHVAAVLARGDGVWTGGHVEPQTVHSIMWRPGTGSSASATGLDAGTLNFGSLDDGAIAGVTFGATPGEFCLSPSSTPSDTELAAELCSTSKKYVACEVGSTCPAGWLRSPTTGTCLIVEQTPATFAVAASNCKAKHAHAQLWTVHDALELAVVHEALGADSLHDGSHSTTSGAWVGAKAAEGGSTWRWLDNSDPAGSLWAHTALGKLDTARYAKGTLWDMSQVECGDCHPAAGFSTGSRAYLSSSYGQLHVDPSPSTARRYVCEYIPPCDTTGANTPGSVVGSTVHLHQPGQMCVYTAPAGVGRLRLSTWGAGGGSVRPLPGKGGGGASASGFLAISAGDSVVVTVGGARMGWEAVDPAWASAASRVALDSGAGKDHQGGGQGGDRSAVLSVRSTVLPADAAVDSLQELIVAGGGGGGGMSHGGPGGSHDAGEGTVSTFTSSGSDFATAYGGLGGTNLNSHLQTTLLEAGHGAGGVVRSSGATSADACTWGLAGARNRAGVSACSEFVAVGHGGGGGGGYYGGGAGAASGVLAGAVSGGGGGSSYLQAARVSFGRLVGGSVTAPGDPLNKWIGATAGRPGFLRGHVAIQQLSPAPPRCELLPSLPIMGTGVHILKVPPGAIAADVALYGAGGSPGRRQLGLDPTGSVPCLGGSGGYFAARVQMVPGRDLVVSVGDVGSKFAPSTDPLSSPALTLGPGMSATDALANGTNGFGVGYPLAPGGTQLPNRGGGQRTALFYPSLYDELIVVGGGGGGGYGASTCGSGGAGGGGLQARGAGGEAAGSTTGGGGGTFIEAGEGGVGDPADPNHVTQGALGDRVLGGGADGDICNGGTCAEYAPSGGQGLLGGGSGATAPGTAVSGAGGGSNDYLPSLLISGTGHPTLTLGSVGAGGVTAHPETMAGAPGEPGHAYLRFRCTHCPLVDSCYIRNALGVDECIPFLAGKPRESDVDVHSQCYRCDPRDDGGFETWSLEEDKICDDELSCTFNDTCTGAGLCQGTLYTTCLAYEWTGDDAQNCEVCDGEGGCDLAPGFLGGVKDLGGGSKSCGCLIDGVVYAHNEVSPDQPGCQYCDVLKDATAWSTRPNGLGCDDGEMCTFDDTCIAGICTGTPYSCETGDCHIDNSCNGDGGCFDTRYMPADNQPCNAGRESECRLAPTCDGTRATCPGYSDAQPLLLPAMTPGQVTPLQTETDITPFGAFTAGDLLSEAANSHTGLKVSMSDFDVTCDSLDVRVGLQVLRSSTDEDTCLGSALQGDTAGTLLKCPAGYTLARGTDGALSSCVKFVETAATWEAAEASCAAEGASLASLGIYDAVKLRALQYACFDKGMRCWLGMSVQAPSLWSTSFPLPHPHTSSSVVSGLPLNNPTDLSGAAPGTKLFLSTVAVDQDTATMTAQVRLEPDSTELPYLCEQAVASCPPGYSVYVTPGAPARCLRRSGMTDLASVDATCMALGGVPAAAFGSDDMAAVASTCSTGQCWIGAQHSAGDPAGIKFWWGMGAHQYAQQFAQGSMGVDGAAAGDWALPFSLAPFGVSAAGRADAARIQVQASTAEVSAPGSGSTASARAVCEAPVFTCATGHVLVQLSAGEFACAFASAGASAGSAADGVCASDEGVALSSPTYSVLKAVAPLCSGSCWTGLSDLRHNGTWRSTYTPRTLGKDVTATGLWPWAADVDLAAGGDCAAVEGGTAAPRLHPRACALHKPVICTKPPMRCPAGHFVAVTWPAGASGVPSYACESVLTPGSTSPAEGMLPTHANPRSLWLQDYTPLVMKRARTPYAKHVAAAGFLSMGQAGAVEYTLPPVAALTQGARYKWVVEARNVEGERFTSCSAGFVVDLSPPRAVPDAVGVSPRAGVREVDLPSYSITVQDDTADVDFQASNNPAWQWNGFQDRESSRGGILEYQYCITSTSSDPDLCDPTDTGVPLAQWKDVAPTGVHSVPTLGLVAGTQYFVHMRAINAAGLTTIRTSDGLTYDNTPPGLAEPLDGRSTCGAFLEPALGGDGTTCDIDFTDDSKVFHVHWPEFPEDISPLINYRVGLGSVLGRPVDDIVAFEDLGPVLNHTFTTVDPVRSGTTVYLIVMAENEAGLSTTSISDGVYVDTVAPSVSAEMLGDRHNPWLQYGVPGIVGNPGDFDADETPVAALQNRTFFRARVTVVDAESGFAFCEVAAGTDAAPESMIPFSRLHPETPVPGQYGSNSISLVVSGTIPQLPDAVIAFLTVRCRDRAQNIIPAPAQPLPIESRRPSAAAAYVHDVDPTRDLEADQDGHSQPSLVASWGSFTAGEASIVSYLWGVSSSAPAPGDDFSAHPLDILPLTYVGSDTRATTNPATIVLTQGTTYFVIVRAVSTNGLFVDKVSDGVVFDGTPPEPAVGGTVMDLTPGVTGDADFTPAATFLKFQWDAFLEDDGAIAKYQYAVRWCDNGDVTSRNVRDWTDVAPPLATTFTAEGLPLTFGLRYCVQVRAVNNVGDASVLLESDGLLVDGSSPVAGAVWNTLTHHVDAPYQGHAANLSASWVFSNNSVFEAWSDEESGLQSFACCAGTLRGACNIVPRTDVGTSTSCVLDAALVDGEKYYVTVYMTNRAGRTTSVTAPGVVIDTTGAVQLDGRGVLVEPEPSPVLATYTSSDKHLEVEWSVLSNTLAPPGETWTSTGDTENGTAVPHFTFQWALGTAAGVGDVKALTDVGTATHASVYGLTLAPGTLYTVTVLARIGITTRAFYADFTPDTTASTPSAVGLTGAINLAASGLPDTLFIASLTTISATWAAFDDAESPSAEVTYTAALGSSPYGQQVRVFEDTFHVTNVTFAELDLVQGQEYHVSLVGLNAAGHASKTVSRAVIPDVTPPLPGRAWDGVQSDLSFTTDDSAFACSWEGFSDDVAPIAHYNVVLREGGPRGAVRSGPVQVLAASPATHTFTFSAGSELANQQQYTCEVTAVNAAGLSTTVTSNAAAVVTTGPLAGTVWDSMHVGVDDDATSDCSAVRATWGSFFDAGGITRYEWCAGHAAGDCDVIPRSSVGRRTFATASGLNLQPGQAVFTSVWATNTAGLTTHVASDGITCDDSAPDVASSLRLQAATLAVVPAGTDRTTCACVDSNAAFVPDFASGGGTCHCEAGFRLDASTGSCVPCAGSCPAAYTLPTPPTASGTCGAGTFSHDGSCVPCPLGTFKAGSGDSIGLCLPCAVSGAGAGITFALNASAAKDAETSLDTLVHAVGTGLGGQQVLRSDGTRLALAPGATASALDLLGASAARLQHGQRGYIGVAAGDAAGRLASIALVGVPADATPPKVQAVWDVAGLAPVPLAKPVSPTADAQLVADGIAKLRWLRATDAESDIVGAQCGWGSAPNTVDIMPFLDVPHSDDFSAGECYVALPPTATGWVYGVLRIMTSAGLVTDVSTNGFVVSNSVPTYVAIRTGAQCGHRQGLVQTLADATWTAEQGGVEACWQVEDADAALAGTELQHWVGLWDVTTSSWIAPLQDVGTATSATWTVACAPGDLCLDVALPAGTVFEVVVQSGNAAGTVSEGRSTAVQVALGAPVAEVFVLGTDGEETLFTPSSSEVRVGWAITSASPVASLVATLGHIAGAAADSVFGSLEISVASLEVQNPRAGVYVSTGNATFTGLTMPQDSAVVASVQVVVEDGGEAVGASPAIRVDLPWSAPTWTGSVAMLQGAWFGASGLHSGAVHAALAAAAAPAAEAGVVSTAALTPGLRGSDVACGEELRHELVVGDAQAGVSLRLPAPVDTTSGISALDIALLQGPLKAGCAASSLSSLQWQPAQDAPFVTRNPDAVFVSLSPADLGDGVTAVLLRATNGAGTRSVFMSPILVLDAVQAQVQPQAATPTGPQVSLPVSSAAWSPPTQRWVQAGHKDVLFHLPIVDEMSVPLSGLAWEVLAVDQAGTTSVASGSVAAAELWQEPFAAVGLPVAVQLAGALESAPSFRVRVLVGKVGGGTLEVTSPTVRLIRTPPAAGHLVHLPDSVVCSGQSALPAVPAAALQEAKPWTRLFPLAALAPSACAPRQLPSAQLPPAAAEQLTAADVATIVSSAAAAEMPFISLLPRLSVRLAGWSDDRAGLASLHLAVGATALGSQAMPGVREVGHWSVVSNATTWEDSLGASADRTVTVALDASALEGGDTMWLTAVVTNYAGLSTVLAAPVGILDATAPAAAPSLAVWSATTSTYPPPGATPAELASAACDAAQPGAAAKGASFLALDAVQAGLNLHLEGLGDAQSGLATVALSVLVVPWAWNATASAAVLASPSELAPVLADDDTCSPSSASGVVAGRVDTGAEVAFQGGLCACGEDQATSWAVQGSLLITPAPAALTLAVPPVPWGHADRLFPVAQVANGAGSQQLVLGQPVLLDGTAPTWSDEVEVRDGGDVDADCILGSPGAVFQASWTPAADTESGIVQYEWCIGSTGSDAGRDDLMPCRLVGDSLEASALLAGPDQAEDGFAWPSGGTLFVSVRAQNGAGTWGAWITSDGARALCDAAQDASCVVEDVRGVLCVAL